MNRLGCLLWVGVLVAFAGCEQRELCYDHSHGAEVDLFFDWSLEPDADVSTMVVWAYSDNGSEGLRFEFDALPTKADPSAGHIIKLPPGTWRLTCYNGNTEHNQEQGKLPGNLLITTYDYSLLAPLGKSGDAPRPPLTENQPVRSPGSHLYAANSIETIVVKETDAHEHVRYKATFVPRRASAIYHVLVEDITGATRAFEASGILTGLAESCDLPEAVPAGREVIVPFEMTVCKEGPLCLRASFVVFGDNAPHDIRHYLRVYTSAKYYFDYDVTGQVHSAPDPKNVYIVVRGMKLPEPEIVDDPTLGVNPWEDVEEIEIDI